LNFDNRLDCTVEFFDHLAAAIPVSAWSVDRGGGGNWDDVEIEDISSRLGCDLQISQGAFQGIKRIIREDRNALGLIKHLRNRLAHGNLSFAECGDGITVAELRDIKDRTAAYLREVVAAFKEYVDCYEFLVPARRPDLGAP
jgi:hypothetical protein